MKNTHRIIFIVLFCFVLAGCQALKINKRTPQTPTTVTDASKAAQTKGKPAAAELFAQAKARYVQAQDLIEAGEYDKAKNLLDEALSFCLQEFEPEKDPTSTVKIDGLFLEVCVTQVRLGHLRGTFVKVLPDEVPLGLEYNPEVERWLSFYLTSGRRSMEIYLARSGKFTPMIEKILAEMEMPHELKYLPIIESGYSPYAYSPAHAVGVWQFIPGTGKRYGLRIDSWVDERRDPEKATRAAASYLQELYRMFGAWPLAMASYNCGEGAVSRAIKRNNTNNYWALDLPTETCNYVPKFYAALLIANDPELYGFFVHYEDPLDYETVVLERPADLKVLAQITDVSYEELKALNPELLSQYTHPKVNGYVLKVPRPAHEEFVASFESATTSEKYLSKKQLAKLQAPKSRGRVVYYRVKNGDTLWKIARRYKTTVKNLKKWNKSARGKYLRPGMKLKIYPGKR